MRGHLELKLETVIVSCCVTCYEKYIMRHGSICAWASIGNVTGHGSQVLLKCLCGVYMCNTGVSVFWQACAGSVVRCCLNVYEEYICSTGPAVLLVMVVSCCVTVCKEYACNTEPAVRWPWWSVVAQLFMRCMRRVCATGVHRCWAVVSRQCHSPW